MANNVRDISWVDVHNDSLMVSLGIRLPNVEPRDMSVWTKTAKEKKEVRKMRNKHKNDYITGGIKEPKSIPVVAKLIVQIYGKIGNKTTFSYTCTQSNIPNILSKFVDDSGKSIIRYYKWNGKTYKPGTLPFWYW